MIKGTEIKMKPHEIAEACNTWFAYPGFTAEACGNCNCTINTFAGGPGYFCPQCDHFNVQCWHGHMIPWSLPDYGPTLRTIRKGHKLATRDTRRKRKFADGQKVLVNLSGGPSFHYGGNWHAARIVSMRDDCYCGMRWYDVVLQNGDKKMLYEEYIRKNGGLRMVVGVGRTRVVELSRAWFPPAFLN